MPQANAQVEAMHKIIIGLIKKYINYGPRNWRNTLEQALWDIGILQEARPPPLISYELTKLYFKYYTFLCSIVVVCLLSPFC